MPVFRAVGLGIGSDDVLQHDAPRRIVLNLSHQPYIHTETGKIGPYHNLFTSCRYGLEWPFPGVGTDV